MTQPCPGAKKHIFDNQKESSSNEHFEYVFPFKLSEFLSQNSRPGTFSICLVTAAFICQFPGIFKHVLPSISCFFGAHAAKIACNKFPQFKNTRIRYL